jgi:hypothetical protein
VTTVKSGATESLSVTGKLIFFTVFDGAAAIVGSAEVLQAGRIGLWQAVLHFDPGRGVAFSSYAGVAIERRIWQAVAQAQRPQGWLEPEEPVNALEIAEDRLCWRKYVRR